MITFKYIARDNTGNLTEGYTDAISESDVLSWLREQGCTPVTVEVISGKPDRKIRLPFYRKVSSSELAAVFWQLNAMVEGGITIAETLEGIAEDMDNAYMQKVLMKILENIEKGGSVSGSMSEFPDVFSKLVCSLVMAGETGGNIADSFQRAAIYYTERDRIKRKVKKALTYPAFVLGFVVVVVVIIMTLVIPRFREMFQNFGQGKLPAFTEAFMGVYDILSGGWYYIVGGIALVVIALVILYRHTLLFHRLFSIFFLRSPLFGNLLKNAFLATFCRTMSNLLKAGVPVLEAFEIVTETNSNDVIVEKLEQTREGLVSGKSICSSMTETEFFPNMSLKMVKAGEESGSLWKTLNRTADFYEEKVDSSISLMTSLLEPLMIIIVGIIVLTVVLALYLPVFQISDIRAGG